MNTARTTSAIAAAVIVGTTLTGCSPSSQPEELRLKNHKGESVSRAVAGMEEAGLDRAYIAARDARSINDEAKGHWTVCRQDPKAGTRITGPVGFEVTLYAVPDGSKCPDYVPTGVMPDVVDMRWKKAKLPLRQAGVNLDMVTLKPMGYGLSSQVTEEDEGSGYDDWVICEQNPDEGDGVNSNTPVELDISEEDSCTAQEEKEEEEERRKKREAAKAAKKKGGRGGPQA